MYKYSDVLNPKIHKNDKFKVQKHTCLNSRFHLENKPNYISSLFLFYYFLFVREFVKTRTGVVSNYRTY